MKRVLLFLVLLSVVSFATASAAPAVEVNYWQPSLSGGAKVTSGGVGTAIDVKDDLGFDDKNMADFRLISGITKFSYSSVNFNGSNTINRQIDFNGTTYSASSTVTSDLKLKYFGVDWDQTLDEERGLATALTFGVKGFQVDAALSDGTNDSAKKATVGFPVVGFSVRAISEKATCFATISGLPLGSYGHFYDAEAGVKFTPSETFSLTAAYRRFDLNVKNDDDFLNFRMSGPYFGAAWHF